MSGFLLFTSILVISGVLLRDDAVKLLIESRMQGYQLPLRSVSADDNPTYDLKLRCLRRDDRTFSSVSNSTFICNFYIREMSETQEEMKIDPSRAQTLISQISSVRERVAAVANGRNVGS